MLTNPYTHLLNSAKDDFKLQVDVTGDDKSLLKSIMPDKGTMQLIVSNLIFNLCNELRDTHHIYGFRPDASTILSILLEPRGLNPDQIDRLSRTSATTSLVCGRTPTSSSPEVSEGLHQPLRGPAIREGLADHAPQPRVDASSTKQGSKRARKQKPSTKAEGSGVTNVEC